MTSSDRERTLKLMAYADGELEGADLEEVERWLAEDPGAMRMANDVAELGSLVKTGFAGTSDARATASFDVADAIMSKIDTGAAAPVVSLDAARRASQESSQKSRNKSTSYPAVGGIVAAMALAASVFMLARPKNEEPLSASVHAPVATHAPVAIAEPPASSSGGGTDPAQAGGGVGVEINIAETADRSASVVYLPAENSLTTSVVLWVDETGDNK